MAFCGKVIWWNQKIINLFTFIFQNQIFLLIFVIDEILLKELRFLFSKFGKVILKRIKAFATFIFSNYIFLERTNSDISFWLLFHYFILQQHTLCSLSQFLFEVLFIHLWFSCSRFDFDIVAWHKILKLIYLLDS